MSTPRILIVYGTTHGQTAKIAARLQLTLVQLGCDVTVSDVKGQPLPPLNGFDGIIVGASVIARGHQPAITSFIGKNVETLNDMPSAFFSVSASAGSSRDEGRAAARRVRDAFLLESGFQPDLDACIAGAIKYTRYNFLLRWYMKKASRKNGGSTDTSRDHEYTNWEQVETFAQQFAELVERKYETARSMGSDSIDRTAALSGARMP
jgi:menaquinone-dependent protoporphyrinogen oxidase